MYTRVGKKNESWNLKRPDIYFHDMLQFQQCQNFPENQNFWLVEIVLKIWVFRILSSLWDGVSKLRVVALRSKD